MLSNQLLAIIMTIIFLIAITIINIDTAAVLFLTLSDGHQPKRTVTSHSRKCFAQE